MRRLKLSIVILAMFLLSACGNKYSFYETVPALIRSDYYISLVGGQLFLGQELSNTDEYVTTEEEGRLIQKLGLYDIKLQDGIVTELRTASPEIKISSSLYVGQTKASIESYLKDTVKYDASDRIVYYDVLNGVGTEVVFNKDDEASIIRFKSMSVTE